VAARRGLVSIDVDVLKAEDTAISSTLSDLKQNVANQTAALENASLAYNTAKLNLAAADAALADTQKQLDAINDKADSVVVNAFVNPPSESAFEALTSPSLEDATVRQQILDWQADSDAKLLDKYKVFQDRLKAEKATRRKAKDAADRAKSETQAALADTEAAVGQQATFAAELEDRLDQRLSEAAGLAKTDPALAAQLNARAAELAAQLNELDINTRTARAQANSDRLSGVAAANKDVSSRIKPVPGGVTSVACPGGGSIQVAGDINTQVTHLLADASAAGITMCGNGYRDPSAQIALRRAHCGSSTYAIYDAPSSACSPPTARPGSSLHEQGLAIDFTVGGSTIGRGGAAYNWLKANAARYGLYNLPSEPWHWSVNGN